MRKSAGIIQPSDELGEKKSELEKFLFDKVYRHPGVLVKRSNAQQRCERALPHLWLIRRSCRRNFAAWPTRGNPRAAADYLAGMTDRFAFEEHKRLIGG